MTMTRKGIKAQKYYIIYNEIMKHSKWYYSTE